MKNLKIRLLFSISILILFLISLVYTFYITKNNIVKTNYQVGDVDLKLIITSIKKTNYGFKIEAKNTEKFIFNYYEEFNYQKGDLIRIKGSLEKPDQNNYFNLFNYRKYLLSKQINYEIKNVSISLVERNTNLMYKIKNKFDNYLSSFKSKDYIYTLILGDRSLMKDEVYENYKNIGVCHLFAISGMHVSLLSGFLILIFNLIFKNEYISYILTIILLLFYLLIVSSSISIFRAVFSFILIAIKKFFNWKIDSVYLLILLASIFLIYNPYLIYNLGFIFSFVISFAILVFKPKSKNYFVNVYKISLISTLVSIPILINSSFEINFISILSNLIFVPFVSLVIFPLTILVSIMPFLDPLLKIILSILEKLSLFFNYISITIPLRKISSIGIIIYYLIITLFLYKNKCFYILILLIIIHYNLNYLDNNAYINILDVGQGDSILVRLPNNKGNILIDTGGNVLSDYSIVINKTIPYLKSLGIHKLDYLIPTHGDYDHIGESVNLISNFKIDNVIFNKGLFNELELELIDHLKEKNISYDKDVKELSINNYKFHFLNTIDYNNENDNSNVIYFSINNIKILLMGDAGINREKDILKKYNLSRIDILKVGHHGSDTSSSSDFINTIKPSVCLISVGNNNFGHPRDSVLKVLNNCNIYRTDQNGSIEIKLKNSSFLVKYLY